MNRLILFPALCLSCIGAKGDNNKFEKPNILIILADDAGYGDFGFMGCKDTKTPNLDLLASDGRFFTDAHVAATVSSPSRAMLMTGRYGQRFGYEGNTSARGHGLPEDEQILPELLKQYGYSTACIGKWHLGDLPSQHPNKQGYDEFYGLIGGSRNYYYNSEKDDNPKNLHRHYQHNGTPQVFDGYITDELTQRAKQIIRESEHPFMMYLSYTAPHSPNQGKKEDMELFEDAPRQTYAAMLYALDRGVGEVVEELKRIGKYDNTIIFFLSDNGGASNGPVNTPLKGFKGNKFEGGHRVPFIVTWGAKLKSDEPFEGLTSSLDIFATVVDAVNIPKRALHKPIDGTSLLPYILDGKSGEPHKDLYWKKLDTRAHRYGDYKVIVAIGIDTVLYNLSTDIDEMVDLSEKEPAKLKQMLRRLDSWLKKKCIEPLWKERTPKQVANGLHKRLMKNEIKVSNDVWKTNGK